MSIVAAECSAIATTFKATIEAAFLSAARSTFESAVFTTNNQSNMSTFKTTHFAAFKHAVKSAFEAAQLPTYSATKF